RTAAAWRSWRGRKCGAARLREPPPRFDPAQSKRLLPVLAYRRQVDRPPIAMVEEVEELHHGIDLVEVFGHREARDLRLEGLEPRRADGQIDALALDLR